VYCEVEAVFETTISDFKSFLFIIETGVYSKFEELILIGLIPVADTFLRVLVVSRP
jgi:hypothetical protein